MTGAARGFRPGERALLVDARGRRYLVTLENRAQFHSHLGSLEHDDIIGRDEGISVRASGGAQLLAVRPTMSEYMLKMRRGAQVVYPKDVGLILVYADVFPGATVIEAGTGSGALTLALARAVGSEGRVISYETREDHHARAAANIADWNDGAGSVAQDNVDLRLGDVFEAQIDRSVDRIVLDLPEPWHAVGTTTEALVAGGVLCSYLPTIPQVARLVETMRAGGFGMITTLEGLVRTWNIEGQSVRPDHRMVAHTGFIVVGRRLNVGE